MSEEMNEMLNQEYAVDELEEDENEDFENSSENSEEESQDSEEMSDEGSDEGDVDLLQQARQIEFQGAVNNDPQRPVAGMFADIDQRLGKIRIFQGGHGDEEIVGEIERIHAPILP